MQLNKSIKLILKVYLLVITIFSVFRAILFASEINRINFNEVSLSTIFQSFVMGIRFDTVITCYIVALPTLLLLILEVIQKRSRIIQQFTFYWTLILFTLTFIISAADIPYFNQFYDRFSIGAFEWMENLDFVVSMIIEEPKYFLFIIPLIIFVGAFYMLLKKFYASQKNTPKPHLGINIGFSLVLLLLIFIGIRGRLEQKSPIRIGTAYFSNNAFLNKLGLNPSFTLMRSYLDSKNSKNKAINLIDNNIAVENVKRYLNITSNEYNSPIARKLNYLQDSTQKPNVILIIMESMSAAKMERHGNKNKLTPFLDNLSHKSIYFNNIYTAGKHTFNGIFSTLFSFPALYRQHPMKQIKQYNGLSSTLQLNGYSTTYFTTHDSQFDNVGGFLTANDFQNIISRKDYPSSEIKTTLGVPDDYMFRFSLPILNELAEQNKPFFTTFMTASDHGPYYIPEYFSPKTTEIKQQIVEYADWSLQQFIESCQKEKWFDNTIFVFIADHGAPLNATYDIALNYFHTPLLIYAPKLINDHKTITNIGSQIDVFPTIMGLIKSPYINNTLGIDLLNETRDYAIINDDDKIGVLDNEFLCIMKADETKLYNYAEKSTNDISKTHEMKMNEMAEYAKSNMQVFQNMVIKGEQYLKD